MSHYTPGEYKIYLFDRLGAKIGKRNAGCYVDAVAAGREALSRGEGHSFVVIRILHNSAIGDLENYDVRLLRKRG